MTWALGWDDTVRNLLGLTEEQLGLLLPAESLALLGSGAEGALAIREFGWPVREADGEVAELVRRLKESTEPDARVALRATESIVALARDSRAWLSVTSTNADIAPTLILVGLGSVLAARLHGIVVEFVSGSRAMIARILVASAAQPGNEVLVTVFSGGVARGGVRIRKDLVDVSAPDNHGLENLAAAARNGLASLVDELVNEAVLRTADRTEVPE